MPLFSYECEYEDCRAEIEVVTSIAERPDTVDCPCGGVAYRVIVAGHGGIQTDNDVKWLSSAIEVLQPGHERPLETRSEYNRYLKDNHISPAG